MVPGRAYAISFRRRSHPFFGSGSLSYLRSFARNAYVMQSRGTRSSTVRRMLAKEAIMSELAALVSLLPMLSKFLTKSLDRRRLRDERGQRAVEAILRAVNETKLYISSVPRG